jgi:hypothetical protein
MLPGWRCQPTLCIHGDVSPRVHATLPRLPQSGKLVVVHKLGHLSCRVFVRVCVEICWCVVGCLTVPCRDLARADG